MKSEDEWKPSRRQHYEDQSEYLKNSEELYRLDITWTPLKDHQLICNNNNNNNNNNIQTDKGDTNGSFNLGQTTRPSE